MRCAQPLGHKGGARRSVKGSAARPTPSQEFIEIDVDPARKRQRLEKAGWKVGSAKEFLGLTDEEEAMIDLKLALGKSTR